MNPERSTPFEGGQDAYREVRVSAVPNGERTRKLERATTRAEAYEHLLTVADGMVRTQGVPPLLSESVRMLSAEADQTLDQAQLEALLNVYAKEILGTTLWVEIRDLESTSSMGNATHPYLEALSQRLAAARNAYEGHAYKVFLIVKAYYENAALLGRATSDIKPIQSLEEDSSQ